MLAHEAVTDEEILEVLIVGSRVEEIAGAQHLVSSLESMGVTEVFACDSYDTFHLVEALAKSENLKLNLFESARTAGFAALGYADLTQGPGVLVSGGGQNGLLSLEPVAASMTNSIPIVVLSSDGKTDLVESSSRQLGNKHVRLSLMARPVCKQGFEVGDGKHVATQVEEALREASRDRSGPTWVDFPPERQTELTRRPRPVAERVTQTTAHGDKAQDDVRTTADLLARSQRPVIVAGRGVQQAGACQALQEFVQTLGLPILTTRSGMDCIPSVFSLARGRVGLYGQRAANFVFQNSDVAIILGSSLGTSMVGRAPNLFGRSTSVVHVDIDPSELRPRIGSSYLGVQMDAASFLASLISRMNVQARGQWSRWVDESRSVVDGFATLEQAGGLDERLPNDAYSVMSTVSKLLPAESVVSFDGGWISHIATHSFETAPGQRVLMETGLESGSSGIARLAGAGIATSSEKYLVAISSLGAIEESREALRLLRESRSPAVVIALNSGGTSEITTSRSWNYPGSGLRVAPSDVDLKDLAGSLGFSFSSCSDPSSLATMLNESVRSKLDVLLEVRVSAVNLSPRPGFFLKENGEWVPLPGEDLAPLLPIDRLEEALLIDPCEVSYDARR